MTENPQQEEELPEEDSFEEEEDEAEYEEGPPVEGDPPAEPAQAEATPLEPAEGLNEAPEETAKRKYTKNPIQVRLTRWEIAKRREQVQKLKLQGLPQDTIAKILGVSIATVVSDLAVVKKINTERVTNFVRDVAVGESLSSFDEVGTRAWAEYHGSKDPKVRLRALDLIRSIETNKMDALISCGIIHPDQLPTQVSHQHTFQIMWNDEVKQKIARTLLEQSLRTQLIEPTPEVIETTVASPPPASSEPPK